MSKEPDNPIKQEKFRKRQELLSRGVDPYPHNWSKKRTSSIQLVQFFESSKAGTQAVAEKSDQSSELEVSEKKIFHIAGRLMRRRAMGKAAFFNIQDEEGELQCYIKKDDFFKKLEEDSSVASGDVPSSQSVKTHENSFSIASANVPFSHSIKTSDSSQEPLNSYDHSEGKLNPWELWKLSDIGDIIGLSGWLFRTQRGEISLRVKSFQILCKSLEVLPEKYHGLEDQELKYRYRHLDLIMDRDSRELFKTRSKIIQEIRLFMNIKGFMEVETPVLQPIYGGAVATPFETYFRRLNQKMYLKISPEMYLKKLIVGGFEKVFEIGKNFRNEGIDRSHNPEFTMMEYYEAYTDYKDQMDQFEQLVCHVAKKIKGSLKFEYQGKELDLTSPWIRISLQEFEDLLCSRGQSTGGDSWLFEYQGKEWECAQFFEEITREIQSRKQKNLNFKKFWKEISISDTSIKTQEKITGYGKTSKDQFKVYQRDDQPTASANGIEKDSSQLLSRYKLILDYAKFLDPQGDFEKFNSFLNQEALPAISQMENLKDELALMAMELTVEKYFWDPVFIMDFPLKSSPLTKKHRSKDSPRTVERFEPYIAGMELGNAYTELNDPVDQRQRMEEQVRYSEEFKKEQSVKQGKSNLREKNQNLKEGTDGGIKAQDQFEKGAISKIKESNMVISHPVDENFLHALEVGMPPTGGVGLGIERLVMILTNQSRIRDSILFPVLRDR